MGMPCHPLDKVSEEGRILSSVEGIAGSTRVCLQEPSLQAVFLAQVLLDLTTRTRKTA